MSAVPAFVAALEVPLELGGAAVTVRPMNVGQICRLLHAAVEPVQLLMSIPSDVVERLTGEPGPTADDLRQLFEVLTEQPERVVEMVAIATGQTTAWVEVLPPDQFAYLFATVVQVNADFFAQAAPVFGAAGRLLQRARPGAQVPPGNAPSTS